MTFSDVFFLLNMLKRPLFSFSFRFLSLPGGTAPGGTKITGVRNRTALLIRLLRFTNYLRESARPAADTRGRQVVLQGQQVHILVQT